MKLGQQGVDLWVLWAHQQGRAWQEMCQQSGWAQVLGPIQTAHPERSPSHNSDVPEKYITVTPETGLTHHVQFCHSSSGQECAPGKQSTWHLTRNALSGTLVEFISSNIIYQQCTPVNSSSAQITRVSLLREGSECVWQHTNRFNLFTSLLECCLVVTAMGSVLKLLTVQKWYNHWPTLFTNSYDLLWYILCTIIGYAA